MNQSLLFFAHEGEDIKKLSALVICEKSAWGEVARTYTQRAGFETEYIAWDHDDKPLPPGLGGWRGDWILSFKSDYIISPEDLKRAGLGAINFHPAPPNLRGVGTYEVALDQKLKQYGVTCHYMNKQVDAGNIIVTSYFDIPPSATPLILQQSAAAYLYLLYIEIVRLILAGEAFPRSSEEWSGQLHTWKELRVRG